MYVCMHVHIYIYIYGRTDGRMDAFVLHIDMLRYCKSRREPTSQPCKDKAPNPMEPYQGPAQNVPVLQTPGIPFASGVSSFLGGCHLRLDSGWLLGSFMSCRLSSFTFALGPDTCCKNVLHVLALCGHRLPQSNLAHKATPCAGIGIPVVLSDLRFVEVLCLWVHEV